MSETATMLTPHLVCRDASEAVAFYQKAFGAQLLRIQKQPDGRVLHAALSVDGALFFVVDEFPENRVRGPQALGGSPVTLHLHVPDCDRVFQQAAGAGCEVGMPLQDMFWGDRFGTLTDPYGHQWSVATTIRQVSPEELLQVVSKF